MAPSHNIVEIGSTAALDQIIKNLAKDQLLVLDFHAVWCGPCHAIAPVFQQLADKFPHVKFAKIDVDAQQELAQRYRISAMPTFKFIKNGTPVDELRGASPPQLQAKVAQHAGSPPAPKPKPAPVVPTGPVEVSLHHLVKADGLKGLGEAADHPLSSIIGPNSGPKGNSYVESATDPKLLLVIPFSKPVQQINAVTFFAVVADYQAPKTVKLFANPSASLDLASADSTPATHELSLSSADIRGNRIELPSAKFKNVSTVAVYIQDNQEGEETTRLDSVEFFGIEN
ncbi:Thioredoxin-like protein 1 [Vanrija pseudolonga]|uniref:Thioredoxin n=1 Tax=Vanrija pseudolonga TaxID=143232 RepID=A0AAF0Y4F8_9TREE|nr:Thioredoxin-like protein 1 [Vanrija pseudolonga]